METDPDRADFEVFQPAKRSGDEERAKQALKRLEGRWLHKTVEQVKKDVVPDDLAMKMAWQVWARIRKGLPRSDVAQNTFAEYHERVVHDCVQEHKQDQDDIGNFRASTSSGDTAGTDAAFESIHERYDSRTLSLAYRILDNEHLAEDANQETWLKVYKVLRPPPIGKYDPSKAPFSSLLFTITKNTALSARKKSRPPFESLKSAEENVEKAREALAEAEEAKRERAQKQLTQTIARADEAQTHFQKPDVPSSEPRTEDIEAVRSYLADLRRHLETSLEDIGLRNVLEMLEDCVPPIASDALLAFVLRLIAAVPLWPALSTLKDRVTIGKPNPNNEILACEALLNDAAVEMFEPCVLNDWLEYYLTAILPGASNKQLREDVWTYLVWSHSLVFFGRREAVGVLYHIGRTTFQSRFRVRSEKAWKRFGSSPTESV